MPVDRRANRINLGLLQLGAAGPLLAAAFDRHALGIGLSWIAVLLAIAVSRRRSRDLRLLLAGAAIGTVGETVLALAGLMPFVHPLSPLPFPAWLPSSWALIGTTTAYALHPLRARPLVGLIVGTLVGVASLYGAMRAGEVTIPHSAYSVVISIWLGTLIAALLITARRIDPDNAQL
ncbi:MAG: DUF2878 family protein [Myxococcota bacterium]